MTEEVYKRVIRSFPHLGFNPRLDDSEVEFLETLTVKELIVRRSAALLANPEKRWRAWILPELMAADVPF